MTQSMKKGVQNDAKRATTSLLSCFCIDFPRLFTTFHGFSRLMLFAARLIRNVV